jgi:hypothetical protein
MTLHRSSSSNSFAPVGTPRARPDTDLLLIQVSGQSCKLLFLCVFVGFVGCGDMEIRAPEMRSMQKSRPGSFRESKAGNKKRRRADVAIDPPLHGCKVG